MGHVEDSTEDIYRPEVSSEAGPSLLLVGIATIEISLQERKDPLPW